MSTHGTFNLKRLQHLMINDLKLQAKLILIVGAALVVFLSLIPFPVTGNSMVYFQILYIGGFIITSFAFTELHDFRRAHLLLTLPCTNLERFLNKWFLTSVGYAIALLIIYYLFSLLSATVNLVIYQQQVGVLDILQPALWEGIGKYIILQSIVLLGSILFKKYALIKTALAMGCLFFLVSMLLLWFAWSFCPNCARGVFMIQTTLTGGYFVFWIIAAPICWFLTYLRLIKYELR